MLRYLKVRCHRESRVNVVSTDSRVNWASGARIASSLARVETAARKIGTIAPPRRRCANDQLLWIQATREN